MDKTLLEQRELKPCRNCGDLDYEDEMQDNLCMTCWEYGDE